MLFGSAAQGALRTDSDVDVAILPSDPDLPLAAELSLQAELSRAAGRDVDLVRLDRASTVVKWQVAKHGVPLLVTDPAALAHFLAASAAEYLDFAPAMRKAQEVFRQRLAAGPRRR